MPSSEDEVEHALSGPFRHMFTIKPLFKTVCSIDEIAVLKASLPLCPVCKAEWDRINQQGW